MKDAASIAVIGAADGPTAIFVANTLKSQYLGAIMVAAYSYMALVPIVQPPVIRLLTTQKERRIRMPYEKGNVTQLTKILFPVVVTVVAGLVAPASVALVGFFDVRQPAAGMRGAELPERDRPERTGKPHHPAAGSDRSRADDRRQVCPAGHFAYHGAGSCSLYL